MTALIQNAIELDVRYILMQAIREGLVAGYDNFIAYGSDDNEDMLDFQETCVLQRLAKVLKFADPKESKDE